jgi:hypothetical protein
MPNPTNARAIVAFAVALAVATCSFPDDQSANVYVVVHQSDSLLARGVLGDGETDFLSARAYQLVGSTADTGDVDDVEIRNIDFFWSSDNEGVATVHGGSLGGADVTGISPGVVVVRAVPKQYQGAAEGTTTLRVAGLYAVDSVRPRAARYGEKVTLFGVRMNLTLGASISGQNLILDPFSFTGNRDGLGRIEFWVPPRATTGRLAFLGPGVFGPSDSVAVTELDRYEPDSALASRIGINGGGGQPTIGEKPTLFYNPALFYEPVPIGSNAVDWFRFVRADTSQAVTFILNSTVLNDTAFSYLSDTIEYGGGGVYFIVNGSFINSPGFYVCENDFFFPFEERSVSTIIALKDLPDSSLQLLSFYARDGRYELAAVFGYHTVDRRFGPDRFEENDIWCKYADRNFNDPTRQIVIGPATPPFADTLTIDNPHDIDWYKFRVTLADTVTLQTKPRPLSGGVDASDIDLYLMRVSDFAQVGTDQAAGSFGKIKVFLNAGDYYLAVVDRIGVPTRYSLCIVRGVACTPPGSAPAAMSVATRRAGAQVRDATVPPPGWTADRRKLPSPRP